jgi:hypothetical protein
MPNLSTELEKDISSAIHSMEEEFDTHELILNLAKSNQKEYVSALSDTQNSKPFMVLHSAIGKHLKTLSEIQEVQAKISSKNIFGEFSSCSKWRKIS